VEQDQVAAVDPYIRIERGIRGIAHDQRPWRVMHMGPGASAESACGIGITAGQLQLRPLSDERAQTRSFCLSPPEASFQKLSPVT
jgi:hypothetical protein